MKLLRIVSILVVVLGLGALALVVAPAVYHPRVSAQSGPLLPERPFDSAQGRPFDDQARPERRAREMTVLAGRGGGLGVHIADTDNGVVIEDVEPDSPADKAGLKKSDVFLEFDGERVRSARQLARLVQETPARKTVKAAVRRDGQRKDVDVTPDDRRGDVMISGDFGDYMRDLGRGLGQLGDRLPNFNFDMMLPGTVSGRRLGVTVQELTPQLSDYFGVKHGVLVTGVAESSSASRAGLKAGDVITTINGRTVESRQDLTREVRDASGDEVTIGIVRDKKESSVKAKIDPPRRITRGRPA